MMNVVANPWLRIWGDPLAADKLLVCVPPSTRGAGYFAKWPEQLGSDVAVIAVAFPACERRLFEPPVDRVQDAVDALVPALEPYLDKPWALFGYCGGSLIALELAFALGARGRYPHHTIIAATRPPHLLDEDGNEHLAEGVRVENLSDDELFEELRALGRFALVGDVDVDSELAAAVGSNYRALVRQGTQYRYRHAERLPSPITAWYGEEDPYIRRDHATGWERYTSSAFAVQSFPGRRDYLHDAQPEMLRAVDAILATL